MKFGHKKLYINGTLRESSDQRNYNVVCPGTEEVVGTLAWGSKEDTADALAAAQSGFELWSQLPIEERLDWIAKLRNKIIEYRDLLRESIMYEMGKVWEGTNEDLTSIIDSLEYYPKEIKKRKNIPIADKEGSHEHHIVHQPLGVVVAFLAYNFPLLNLGFKLGPALSAGCSIILKPSEYAPLSAYIIGELCASINFPNGVVNVICGDTKDVGIPLSESKIPRLITIIGSTETAQRLMAQGSKSSVKRYSMECGGNAPFIVFEDADVDLAVAHGAALKIGNSGQICVAPNRFYIQESIMDEFISGMVDKFKNTKLGFGKDNSPDLGPLANKMSVGTVDNFVQSAIDQGGELILGGQRKTGLGYYYPLTIIKLDNPQAPILQEEVFGPVAVIIPFSKKEDVIKYANSTDAGLASYVYSQNVETLRYFEDRLEFGEVHLNGFKFDIYLPHGGIKNSGSGVDCSPYALDDYLIKKRVTKALSI